MVGFWKKFGGFLKGLVKNCDASRKSAWTFDDPWRDPMPPREIFWRPSIRPKKYPQDPQKVTPQKVARIRKILRFREKVKKCQKVEKVTRGQKSEKKWKKRVLFLPYQRLINCQRGKNAQKVANSNGFWWLKNTKISRSALLHGRIFFWQLLKTHFFSLFFTFFQNSHFFLTALFHKFSTFLKKWQKFAKSCQIFWHFFTILHRTF